MKRTLIIAAAILAVMSFSLAGCASRKAVESTADLSYTKEIHKVYVIAELPRTPRGEVLYLSGESTLVNQADPGRKAALAKAYVEAMEKALKDKGIEAKCEVPTGLELDEDASGKRAAAFSPDAILVIDCYQISLRNGSFTSAEYDVSLIDYPSQKRVWRGKFKAVDPYAAGLAKKILKIFLIGLKEDNMGVFGIIEK